MTGLRDKTRRNAQAIRAFLRRRSRSFSTVGLLVATLFFAFSLTPSLVPRTMLLQGIVSGFSLSLGYLIGWSARWLWSAFELPNPGWRVHRIALWVAGVLCVITAAIFLWQASTWQNSVRLLMGMEPVETVRPFTVALIALAIFLLALIIGRAFRRTFRFISHQLKRIVPRRIAYLAGLVLAATLFWAVMEGLVMSALLRTADGSYQQLDALIPDDLDPPHDPLRSGSNASLIRWQDLGRHGRLFVTRGPRAREIAAFAGEYAHDPIRVYVGLNAADTVEARAELALRELVRVGAFQRSVLLLITPTGTGWVDPDAIDSLEYLHRGDIASVAAQYSYLPSPIALIAEGSYGAEMAAALFDAVYGHWQRLPKDARPKLYLHGLSLGVVNSEQSFHLHDILADPFHGALWAGPPFRSAIWSNVTANRRPGSPQWLPRYRDQSIVRFMNQHTDLRTPDTAWGPLRIAYLQYASDPVSFFSVETAIREPDWMHPPRGPDVSPELRWYPVVTMLQLAADMLAGGDSVPPGHGHNFAVPDYVEAWLALTEPKGWNAERIELLVERLEQREVR